MAPCLPSAGSKAAAGGRLCSGRFVTGIVMDGTASCTRLSPVTHAVTGCDTNGSNLHPVGSVPCLPTAVLGAHGIVSSSVPEDTALLGPWGHLNLPRDQ